MSSLSQTLVREIAPGAVASLNTEGKNFWVVFSPVTLQIKWPNSEFGYYEQGSGVDNLPGDETFKRLEVRNPSLGTVKIVIYVGGPLYRDSRLQVASIRARLSSWNATSLAGLTDKHFDGLTPAGGFIAGYIDLKRKAVIIDNLDPANPLLILDAAGGPGGVIFSNTSKRLDVSEALTIRNATAAAIACYIQEVWETIPF